MSTLLLTFVRDFFVSDCVTFIFTFFDPLLVDCVKISKSWVRSSSGSSVIELNDWLGMYHCCLTCRGDMSESSASWLKNSFSDFSWIIMMVMLIVDLCVFLLVDTLFVIIEEAVGEALFLILRAWLLVLMIGFTWTYYCVCWCWLMICWYSLLDITIFASSACLHDLCHWLWRRTAGWRFSLSVSMS